MPEPVWPAILLVPHGPQTRRRIVSAATGSTRPISRSTLQSDRAGTVWFDAKFAGPDTASAPHAVTVLPSSVTAAFRASRRPLVPAPVVTVMLCKARMLPANAVPVPSVAELPTCQNTLQELPPLITFTREALAVVKVLPIWKMKTASGLPCASSVSVPVRPIEPAAQYTPGVRVVPPRSAEIVVLQARPASVL